MYKRWFTHLTVTTAILFAQTESSDSTVKGRQMLISPFFQNYGTSWIAGPEGHHYQFHRSEQSWNMAREYCLALASDLVVIKSLQQINWLISHYPPSNSIMPERTAQIGLVLVDKQNSAEKEWKWVDNTPLNTTYLEWEILVTNITEKILHPTERSRCALLSIDNRVLKAIPCDQTPDFDYTNRFICQRSDEKHQEHERKNNPFYEFFVQLISKLRTDAAAKPEPRTVQLQGVKTQTTNVQGRTEDLSPISRKKDVTDENKEDRLSKVQRIIPKETLATVDPDVKGVDEMDFAIEQKEKGKQEAEVKNKIANENKPELRAKNFAMKEKSMARKENTADKDVIQPPKQNFQHSSELCGENGKEQKGPRTRYEQFGDIFRNLNLFLKQEKSSNLRALLDNKDTNKTLVERLKEVLHTKNNKELSKHDVTEKKGVLENEVEDEQQIDASIQEVHDVRNTLAREIDDINDVFLYKNTPTTLQKLDRRPVTTDRMYGTTEPGKTEIYEKEELAGRSEVNENKIYELLGEKVKSIFAERLQNISNLDSNATNKPSQKNKEITSNTSEHQINRNEVSVQHNVANEQKLGSPSLLSTNRGNKVKEYATGVPHIFISNTQQTTKRWVKSSNESGTSLAFLNGNIILLEEYKQDRNKTNIKTDVEKAISNMKQKLENVSEEIKRLFSHSR
ncbi:lectin C-type domain-containing protein [Loa loa]|uniref:Lectin C-type domain-containing protein n=1 Tax=Loa loa TaxID=7209 RepID=A0A1S0U7X4_LOALO|nr:lectin C-type domain-containing protein [Loa loa]EFO26455.1 lectin C-type domain-containing protein [Loa loa]